MEPELTEAFAAVCADPGAAGSYATAARVFERIARDRVPEAWQLALMTEHALVWAGLGFSREGQALLRRWRHGGVDSPALRHAEVIYCVNVAPGAAAAHLRELGATDPQVAALDVVNSLFRGELRAAVELSRAHRWFLDDDDLAHGLFHAVWALSLMDRFAEAEELVADWKRRHPHPNPNARQFVLRTEAGVASFQQRYAEEEALIEEALAVCIEHDLGIARAYTEANVVSGRARAGNLRGARALAATWPRRRRNARGPIEAFRDVAALEVSILAENLPAARRAGARTLEFWEDSGHSVMTSFVRLRMALAAGRDEFPAALAELRRVVRRSPIIHFSRRLALIDELVARGYASAGDVRLVERSRHGAGELPLARVWTPPVTAVGADLFWNRVVGTLHIRGRGPYSLAERPVLRRTLEVLLARPGFALPLPALFSEVWGGPYDPIRHEGKIHVTLHRLRSWLDDCAAGTGAMLEVQDGVLAIRRTVDVRVLEPPQAERAAGVSGEGKSSVRERVLQCIRAEAEPLAPRELLRRLDISRPALNVALRALVAGGHIERLGVGRATRYRRRGR